MNRLNKFVVSFVLLFYCLLVNVSHAYPDLYFFNNFLAGQSPYYTDNSNSEVYYYPSNSKEFGVVTSFDNTIMNGNSIPDAVPLLDLDYTVGKVFELKPNECMVVTSLSGDVFNLYANGTFYYSKLGTTQHTPDLYVTTGNLNTTLNAYNYALDADKEPFEFRWNGTSTTGLVSGMSNVDAFYIPRVLFDSSNGQLYFENSNSNGAYILFLMNFGETSAYFSTDKNLISNPVVTYEAEGRNMNSVSMLMYCGINWTSNESGKAFYLPHIDGLVDVYSANIAQNKDKIMYTLGTHFNMTCQISLDSDDNVVVGVDSTQMSLTNTQHAYYDDMVVDKYCPFFLSYRSAVTEYYPGAIYVKDGYIDISNYEELVALLKENGIGQADLTRVIALLEAINTGGATGEQAKELIGILEAYHDEIIQNSDFAGVTNAFDDYKDLLEFSEDMHWLITANNALFGYFAGFIMLCAMFLFLGRVMR